MAASRKDMETKMIIRVQVGTDTVDSVRRQDEATVVSE